MEALPKVTVQIPLRNERYVARRVIRHVAALTWPRDRLEIQILDDSDDETTVLVRRAAARLRARGHDIQVLHRARPAGQKAGALAAGLRRASGDFIAHFDADFCPPPDFLQRLMPHLLVDETLGAVQARWGHLNATASPLTRAQALIMDAHFTVEQIARNRSGLLMNFNGTAGIWRRAAIVDAGGWQSDTVTEDLDLSYRAQLRGWRLRYLPDVVAPAELPNLLVAFKSQQYRWAKGAAQTLRKLWRPILTSPRLSFLQKFMALLHLSGYFHQPLFLLLLLLTLPVAYYQPALPPLTTLLGTLLGIPPLLYVLGQVALYRDWPRRLLAYPMLAALGMGLTWNTTLALLDGLLHWGGDFVRTPKGTPRGTSKGHPTIHPSYHPSGTPAIWGELILGFYALLALWQSGLARQPDLLPIVAIYLVGETVMVGVCLLQELQYP